jgi:hypothetical protein
MAFLLEYPNGTTVTGRMLMECTGASGVFADVDSTRRGAEECTEGHLRVVSARVANPHAPPLHVGGRTDGALAQTGLTTSCPPVDRERRSYSPARSSGKCDRRYGASW